MRRAAVLIAAALLAGCSAAPAGLVVSGTVADDPVTVTVPALGAATVVQVATVAVDEGDLVHVGQVLARMDDRVLVARTEQAKADAEVAATQVDQLAAAIAKTDDAAADIAEKKQQIKDAISKLTSTKKTLVSTRAKLKAQRPQLVEKLRQAQQLLDNYPPVPVPGVPSKDELAAAITKLTAGIAQIDAGLKKINTAVPKLDDGLKKAREGLGKLEDAADNVVEARAQLVDLKELATIAADTMQIPVRAAQQQVSLAEVTAPVDGVVIAVASAGDQLAPGATVASLRESTPSRITTWLSPAQAGQVCTGDAADLSGDWSADPIAASITTIATSAEYPPSSVATDEVHLTRAIEVTLTASSQLPAGLPVQISLHGCRMATDPSSADR